MLFILNLEDLQRFIIQWLFWVIHHCMNNQQFRSVHHFEIFALYFNTSNEMHEWKKIGLFYCYMTEKNLKPSIRTVSFSPAEKKDFFNLS